jgi:hypothetical protein
LVHHIPAQFSYTQQSIILDQPFNHYKMSSIKGPGAAQTHDGERGGNNPTIKATLLIIG